MKKVFLFIFSVNMLLCNDVLDVQTSKQISESEQEVKDSILNLDDKVIIDLGSVQKSFFQGQDKTTVKVYKYSLTQTIKLAIRIFMKSTIILPNDEIPVYISQGDGNSFVVEGLNEEENKFNIKNILTIKTKFLGVDSNLIVVGSSGRIYNFYLYSIGYESKEKPNLTTYITLDGKAPKIKSFTNLEDEENKINELKSRIVELENKLYIEKNDNSIDLTKFNLKYTQFDYSFKNDMNLEAVFNDTKYTYFKFKKGFEVPRIFYLDNNNNQVTIQYSIDNNIIKINKLEKKWVLRINNYSLSVTKKNNFTFKENLKDWFVNLHNLDFSYKIQKNKNKNNNDLVPDVIFHDNELTYFKFNLSSGFNKFPVIYKVLDGYDSPVSNFEIVNDYVVVKSMNKKYTLALGEEYLCIEYFK